MVSRSASAKELVPIRETVGDWSILRSLRSKLCLSPSLGRFPDRHLDLLERLAAATQVGRPRPAAIRGQLQFHSALVATVHVAFFWTLRHLGCGSHESTDSV